MTALEAIQLTRERIIWQKRTNQSQYDWMIEKNRRHSCPLCEYDEQYDDDCAKCPIRQELIVNDWCGEINDRDKQLSILDQAEARINKENL